MAEAIIRGEDGLDRCGWSDGDPLYRRYHDTEWGLPLGDDRHLFERLCLEGFQAGLSWLTILRKRDRFREVFAGFDPARVAAFGPADVARLMSDPGIVRHGAKIAATIANARRYPALVEEFGSLAAYLWSFEPAPTARPAALDDETLLRLSVSPESIALSSGLRRRGWSFVGPTTAYAAMQAVGIVDDHLPGCHVRAAVEAARAAFIRPASRRQ